MFALWLCARSLAETAAEVRSTCLLILNYMRSVAGRDKVFLHSCAEIRNPQIFSPFPVKPADFAAARPTCCPRALPALVLLDWLEFERQRTPSSCALVQQARTNDWTDDLFDLISTCLTLMVPQPRWVSMSL